MSVSNLICVQPYGLDEGEKTMKVIVSFYLLICLLLAAAAGYAAVATLGFPSTFKGICCLISLVVVVFYASTRPFFGKRYHGEQRRY
jgi:hypothetical protein